MAQGLLSISFVNDNWNQVLREILRLRISASRIPYPVVRQMCTLMQWRLIHHCIAL